MTQSVLYRENLYILDDGRVREFLILGEKEALLMDTGFEDSHVYDAVRERTGLPVKVLMTHGDMDHTGGLKEFKSCFLNEKDWHLLPEGVEKQPLKEGDIFRCGGYELEVIEIPGHTYGSVAFADWKKRLLFTGDSVQIQGPIFMFGSHRNLDLYIESQKKLCGLMDKIDTILPCHHAYPVTPDYIEKNLRDAEALREGRLEGEDHPTLPCKIYKGKWTIFFA